MSQDLPIPRQDNRADGTAVVEWGPDEPGRPEQPRRRPSLAALTRDHRLPLALAGLGAAAAIASLVGEWVVLTLPNGGPEGNQTVRVPNGVGDIGGFGIGYLAGLLGLAVAVALALRGTAAVRPNARVAGLALAVAVAAVLTAHALSLDGLADRTFYFSSDDGYRAEYGRGLTMAFLATLLLAAALHLAGRAGGPAAEPAVPAPDGGAGEPEPGEATGGWRRPGAADPDEPLAPADLTVQPAAPFAHPEPPR
ncbi:hypothetical protein K7640_17545 [Micromonospora sp. PLK6-60]|uniref:hypothetical protein n=1 Tax=Micromonospora sp. PLK6-60 TaxID=2873383 RepID=UPI001CA764EC|nr:hypothetical protein [Micromonospora sp. PLK6-60]MBY8873639.1 hypothetical protein [Micromonospora sp. PLK6-60]